MPLHSYVKLKTHKNIALLSLLLCVHYYSYYILKVSKINFVTTIRKKSQTSKYRITICIKSYLLAGIHLLCSVPYLCLLLCVNRVNTEGSITGIFVHNIYFL